MVCPEKEGEVGGGKGGKEQGEGEGEGEGEVGRGSGLLRLAKIRTVERNSISTQTGSLETSSYIEGG